MSNPWETNNPWGKGSKEWNRWMNPDQLEETAPKRSSKTNPSKQECPGVQIIRNADPLLPRYYSTNVLHFYYCEPALGVDKFLGHFAISVQSREHTKPLYYPAGGESYKMYDAPVSVENPIVESLLLKKRYLDEGRMVVRYSMKIEETGLFVSLRTGIGQDPNGQALVGEAFSCVQACKDLINFAYENWKDPHSELFADPDRILNERQGYLSYFPLLRHASLFPREIFLATLSEPYFFGVGDMAFSCNALKSDKIFEVNVFEP
jgi:hypothetical protein